MSESKAYLSSSNSKPETQNSKLCLRMHILQKPLRRNLPPYSGFPRARQHVTADGGELQAETDVVAKTADRIVFTAAGMLTVDQLGERWKIPDRAVHAREWVLPTIRDIGYRLTVNADDYLKRFGLAPVDDQRIGALVRCCVELARFDTGD